MAARQNVYVINPPAINSTFEVGLAVETDGSLGDDEKLPIYWPKDGQNNRAIASVNLQAAVGYAMAWTSNNYANNPYRKTSMAAAQIAIRGNLIGAFIGQDGTT